MWHGRFAGAGLIRARTSLNIHGSAIRQLIEQSNANVVPALRIGQSQQDRLVAGMARLRAMKSVQPRREFLPPVVLRQGFIVRDIVTAPHESIDSAQRLTLGSWQDQKRVVEILRR